MDTEKRLDCVLKNIITIIGSLANIIGGPIYDSMRT
jgi:hypothetical protein